MDVHKLERVIQALGAKTSMGAGKVRCQCLLAPWTHTGGRDENPSMVVFPHSMHGGGPVYACLGCHNKGSFRGLILFLWHKTRRDMFDLIEILDSEGGGDEDLKGVPRRVADKIRGHRKAFSGGYEGQHQKRVTALTGAPWVDERAISQADEVPEIPWKVYAEYAGKIPAYAMQRGLTIATCQEWEIGDDPVMKRMLFPLRDRHGRLVCITGRLYEEKTCLRCGGMIREVVIIGKKKPKRICSSCGRDVPPKYLHSDGFKRNLFLYGENRMQPGADMGYVVEGNIDQLGMWQDGYRPVVATLGSALGVQQIEKMVSSWHSIKVIRDGDDAGIKMAMTVKQMVAGRVPVFIVDLPDGRDPGDLTTEEKLEIIGRPLTNHRL